MPEIENRTTLPLASAAGCSCCPPSAKAGEVLPAVVIPDATTSDAGTHAQTLSHLSH